MTRTLVPESTPYRRSDSSDPDLDAEEAENQLEIQTEASNSDQENEPLGWQVFDNRGGLEDKVSGIRKTDETVPDQPPTASMLRKTPVNITRSARRSRKGVINVLNEMTSESSNIQAIESNTFRTEENFTTEEHEKRTKYPTAQKYQSKEDLLGKALNFQKQLVQDVNGLKRQAQIYLSSTENKKVRTPSSRITEDPITWDTHEHTIESKKIFEIEKFHKMICR